MKRQPRAFIIALSGISAAVAAGALTLGSYVPVLLAAGYVIAVLALMMPLAKDVWWGSALTFCAALLLAFLFCGFSFINLIPFAAFFGLHPIANYLQKRYAKHPALFAVCEAVKAVWFDLVMWLSFDLVFVPLFGLENAFWYSFVRQYFFLVLFFGGTVFFLVYDAVIFYAQRAVNALLRRIRR